MTDAAGDARTLDDAGKDGPAGDGSPSSNADVPATDSFVDPSGVEPPADGPRGQEIPAGDAGDGPSSGDGIVARDTASEPTRDLGGASDAAPDGLDGNPTGPEAGAPGDAGDGSEPVSRDAASGPETPADAAAPGPIVVTGSPRLCDSSGWCWLSPLPTGNDLSATLVRGGSDVWVAGDYGTVLHWNGSAWTQYNLTETIHGISAEPSGAVWVAGENGLAARFDGTAFTITPTGVSTHLNGIAAVGDDRVYAVGDEGVVLEWDGGAWTLITSQLRVPIPESTETRPEAGKLSAVWGIGPDDVWIGADGVCWHKVGGTWSLVNYALNRVTAIAGSSATNVWLRGESGGMRWDGSRLLYNADLELSGGNGIWVGGENDVWMSGSSAASHWDGSTWTQYKLPATGLTYTLGGLSGTGSDLWGAGENGSIVRWDGQSWGWALPDTPGQNESNHIPFHLKTLWASSPTDIWMASMAMNRLYHYDGKRTTEVVDRAGTREILDFWGAAPDDVWAFGADGIGHWNGTSWSLVPNISVRFEAASGLSSSDIWAVAKVSLSGSKAYHFDGSTWTSKSTGLEQASIHKVFAASPTMVWAGGASDEMMRWDGTSWTKETSIPRSPYGSGIQVLWGSGPSDIWAFGEQAAYHYDGTGWTIDPTAKKPLFGWGSGAHDFWGIAGNVYHYDGNTWTPRPVSAFLRQDITGSGPGEVFVAAAQGLLRWGGN